MAASLYERIGGQPAILAAVDRFYDKLLADQLTRPFFQDLDMSVLVQKQVGFMTWAFGGPVEQRGRDLRVAHRALVRDKGLGDAHFDRVALHLEDTLRELGVAEDLIRESLAIIGGLRAEVLDR